MRTLGDIWIQSCISCLLEGFQPSVGRALAKTFPGPKNYFISGPSKDYLPTLRAGLPTLLSQLTTYPRGACPLHLSTASQGTSHACQPAGRTAGLRALSE